MDKYIKSLPLLTGVSEQVKKMTNMKGHEENTASTEKVLKFFEDSVTEVKKALKENMMHPLIVQQMTSSILQKG